MQIDGRYYDQEGKYQLIDTADLDDAVSTINTNINNKVTKTGDTFGKGAMFNFPNSGV